MRRRIFLKTTTIPVLASCLPLRTGWPFASETKAKPLHYGNKQIIDELTKLIPQLMQESVVPGTSIALVGDGKVFWQQGFGVKNVENKERVGTDTVFEAASVSKTVFAYFVLKLCENKVIGLDTPLSKYVPMSFLGNDPQLDLITPRHVLSHTTGFQNIRSTDSPLKVHFKPGSQFDYSGEGYWCLQSVIARVHGRENAGECGQYEADLKVCATDFDAALKQNVLAPFGMKSSGYVWRNEFAKQAASPHDVAGKPHAKKRPTATDIARYGAMGELHTTCTDYAKFLIEVLDPRPANSFRLTKKMHQEMLRPQVKLKEEGKIDGADAWALGWAVQQRKTGDVILHSGGQDGFRSLTMGSVARKSGFVMFTNSDNGGKVLFHPKLATVLNTLLIS
ncbi:CubicO group peptidase, beta-lactamase class C family [Dyadobacter soli]|uniref:CubicO group peptidase, beta-lactamase class C family n=1 Tax=Dyadobacter soli TaxID=659014 RepID=A0A1G6Y4Y3_9BACT|nr:serine hydrolase domain-containing protein [Dyadobacter soli]SDD85361.1 CubicO group peptidase, beta-lactamase class C family [Dyadobacter soli]